MPDGWTDMPGVYDDALGPALFEPFAPILAARVAAAAPQRVLELAAGTGRLTRRLVAAMPQAEVVATDLNPGMVSFGAGQVAGARWQVADAQALPFADGRFDAVVCQFGAMFFPDRPAAYAEAARALTGSGSVVLAIWDDVRRTPLSQAMVDSLGAVFPDNPPTFIERVPHGYCDPARIREDLQAGGLADVTVEAVTAEGTADSAGTLAYGYCYGTPLRFELERRGPLEQVATRLTEEMTARLGPGPLQAGAGALLVTARRG